MLNDGIKTDQNSFPSVFAPSESFLHPKSYTEAGTSNGQELKMERRTEAMQQAP